MMFTMMLGLAAAGTSTVHDTRHPIGAGVRTGAWTGPYHAPLIGGMIKVRAAKWIGFNGFWDNAATMKGRLVRHDHVIGFNGYFPSLLKTKRFYVAPTLGSCVDFRITTPLDDRLPSSNNLLFGVHGGLTTEVLIWHRITFEASAEVFGYMGNAAKVEDWSATASNTYQTSAVGQLVAGISYTL